MKEETDPAILVTEMRSKMTEIFMVYRKKKSEKMTFSTFLRITPKVLPILQRNWHQNKEKVEENKKKSCITNLNYLITQGNKSFRI